MILVCGATGALGGRIARRLNDRGAPVRALVRPASDANDLTTAGIPVARGDIREPATLPTALAGVDTVVTTANALGRMLAGPTDLTITNVDRQGNQGLIAVAAARGVRRFVFVSLAGLGDELAALAPLASAKRAAEQALRGSRMQAVIVRPDAFQEVWLAPQTGIDARAGKALIYGRGQTPLRYVAIDDVAELCAHLALLEDPPELVEFGGPEPLTRMQVVAGFESALGHPLKVRHVPRAAMSVGHRVMGRIKPDVASLMGMALYADTHPPTWDDAPLRAAGIEPRPATTFIRAQVAALA